MSKPRAFGTLPKHLPNEGSPHQTPASLMIDTHYTQLGLVDRWGWERYVRLCQFLQMTPCEVASLITLSHGAVAGFKRRGRLCGHGHRGHALILTLLEAHLMAKWTNDVIANPFPDLSRSPPSPALRKPFPGRRATSLQSAAGCGANGS